MDKTLLRPLFQKRFMELHKPQGFVTGGPAMNFQQLAMNNQSQQPSKDQGIMTITKPSGMQESVEIETRTPTQDVNIKESIISGRENERALNEQKNIEEYKTSENVDPTKLEYFESAKTSSSLNQKPETIQEEKIDKSRLFSDADKRGLFAGYLAVALAQPGDPIANLGMGLGQAAQAVGKLKATEAEFAANQKQKFEKTKEVYDNQQGKNVLRTEAEIQTEMMADGTRRYGPKQESSKKSFKLMKVYDSKLNKNRFMPENVVYDSVTAGEERFEIADDGFLQVRFNEDTDYGDKGDTGFVPKFAVRNNPKLYSLAKKDSEIILEGIIGKERTQANEKRITGATNQLFKAREANEIIKTIKGDLTERGAEGGALGDLIQTVAGGTGFLSYFGGFEKSKNHDQQYREIQNALFNPQAYFNDPNVKTTREERERIVALSKKIRNNKGLRSLFDPSKQAASQQLRTSVVNLAYALAKAREEGGRFSVTDIEMAMRTIGDSSNKITFLAALDRTGLELLRPAVNNYLDARSIQNPDVEPKLPKRLQYLQDDLDYYNNPAKARALQKEEKTKEIENQGDDIPEL